MNVVFGAVEAAHVTGYIEVGDDTAMQPSARTPCGVADALVFDVFAGLRPFQDRPQKRRHVSGHHLEGRLAIDFVLWLQYRVGKGLIDKRVLEIAIEIGDRPRNVVREEPHLRFLRLQLVADPDVLFDVRHHCEGAADAAPDLAVREQGDARPTAVTVQLFLATFVRHRGAGEGALDVALHLRESVRRQHVLESMPGDVFRRRADARTKRFVGKSNLELAIEIQDGDTDTVGNEAQPMFALPCLQFELLQMIDIAVRQQKPPHLPLRVAIGVVVDANPDRRAAGRDQLPLVGSALAGQRRLDVGAIELEDVAPHHLDGLAAQHVGLAHANPVEVSLVDEAVTLVTIDVRHRQPEHIELALR